jgi:serine phosphatase RsbU (regulator of sigma subunit)
MHQELVRKIPIFASLPDDVIHQLIMVLTECTLSPGEILLHEGESSENISFLVEGEVEIIKAFDTDGEHLLAVEHAGSIYGELSLFNANHLHTATVRALTNIRILEIPLTRFLALLREYPEINMELLRITSGRLLASEDSSIVELREKNAELTQAYEELRSAHAQIVEKEKLEKEMSLARFVQQSLLPPELPRFPELEFSAQMKPARFVGGDFYDFIPMKDRKLGIAIGDVSDKGMAAALFMALTYSLVRAEASRSGTPDQILQRVNRQLLSMNRTGMFVTMNFAVWEHASHRLVYARAGHPPPIVLDAEGRAIEIPYGLGQAIGFSEHPVLDLQEVIVPIGGLVFFYSDGSSEAMDSLGREFGMEGLVKSLQSCLTYPAVQVCSYLMEEVLEYQGREQQDDITLVTMKLIGN